MSRGRFLFWLGATFGAGSLYLCIWIVKAVQWHGDQ